MTKSDLEILLVQLEGIGSLQTREQQQALQSACAFLEKLAYADCCKDTCFGNLVNTGIDPEDGDRILVCDTCGWTFGERDDFGKPPEKIWILTDNATYYPSFSMDFVSREQAMEAFDAEPDLSSSEITLIEGVILKQKGGRYRV